MMTLEVMVATPLATSDPFRVSGETISAAFYKIAPIAAAKGYGLLNDGTENTYKVRVICQ